MPDTTAVAELWARLEAWLTAHAPALIEVLGEGATDEVIAATEAAVGVTFPDDVRASYRLHDGQRGDFPLLVPGPIEFLSLERIQGEWTVWKQLLGDGTFAGTESAPVGPIRSDWWNPAWVPFTYDGSGNHLCLDLAPAEGGHVGQVISFWHDEATREVEAPSFTAWLADLVDGCETGRYVYAEGDGLMEA